MTTLEYEELKEGYLNRVPLLNRSLENIMEALEYFLKEQNVFSLGVTGRIKSFDSFREKVERKNYTKPFEENEDFCGIRIVVYYLKDIQTVQEIIDTEFDLQESFDKADELEINEFGYRSKHSIVKIKKEWLAAPNYRGLENIKVEIQVRTILMHAWAEIEHQLAYKNKTQIPKEYQRELSGLSAKFEESDRQFQKLKDEIESYKDDIKLSVESHGMISKKIELNYDSLIALLDYYLPDYPRNQKSSLSILTRLISEKISIEQVESLLKRIRPLAASLNHEVFPNKNLHLTQGTILSYADDIFHSYDTNVMYSEARRNIVEKFKAEIANDKLKGN